MWRLQGGEEVEGWGPRVFGHPPKAPLGRPLGGLAPHGCPPFGVQVSPPLAHKASSWACWPKAQAQNQKNRRIVKNANFKFEFELKTS